MDKALALADWKGFPARRAAAERAGRLRGIGLCCFLEVAGGILDETVDLRFEADGRVALRTGAQAMGQGHLSTFVPLIAAQARRAARGGAPRRRRQRRGARRHPERRLALAHDGGQRHRARLQRGDRRRAARWPPRRSRPRAADIEFAGGRYRVVGTDRADRHPRPCARRIAGKLDAVAKFVSPQMSFPNGCHVCEVEIDPETGVVSVVGYAAVDDVGTVMHETIVEGQIHGGIAQGLGQVLGEQVVYGDDGQLLTASFMDYPLPRADDLPQLKVEHHSVPCTTNPLGVKGAGESGVAGALPSGMNAVLDALASIELDLPFTPRRVWEALRIRGQSPISFSRT